MNEDVPPGAQASPRGESKACARWDGPDDRREDAGRPRTSAFYFCADRIVPAAASSITCATTSGCETKTAWLAFTEVTFAPER